MILVMKRGKIAITVKDDILKRLDRAIDGKTIRNRSHAIEYFLNQALGTKVEKALIIGGHKDFSVSTLFENKSVAEHQVELLKGHGIKEILFSLHKNEREVQKLLGDGSKYGLSIVYEWEDQEQTGTARMVSKAKKFVGASSFYVLYCHVVADLDLVDFAAYHAETDATVTVAVTSIKDPSLYGVVQMRGEKIVGFIEKPRDEDGVSRIISAGIFCFSPEIFEYIGKEKSASLERDVFPRLAAAKGKLAGYMFEGKWCNVRNQVCYPATGKNKKRK
jgi:NDP-sugar pyrophosphorylase family protein